MPKVDCIGEGAEKTATNLPDYDDYLNTKINAAPRKRISKLGVLKHTIQTYASDAAIDGIRYFAGPRVTDNVGTRIFWSFTFVVSLVMGVVVFTPIWHTFVDKATLNLQETIEMSEFEFPAITFCNFNMWKRSLLGSHYAPYMYMDRKFRERHNMSIYGKDVCGAEPFYKTVPNFRHNTTWFDSIFSNPQVVAATFGYYYILLDSSSTSYTSVQSCMFKGRKLTDFECYSSFQNRLLSDTRICFTFNPSESLRKFSMAQIDPSIPGFISSTLPAPLPGVIDYKVKATGRATAIEFLMNVQQYEYCTTGATDGVGLEVQVHSRDVQPLISDLMNNVVKLSPGTDVTLTIEEQHTIRETESAGWCSSHIPLKYYDHLEIYDRDACFTECLTDKIINKCKCFPIFVPPAAVRDRYNELAKLYENPRRLMEFTGSYCFVNDTMCQETEITVMSRDKSVISECNHCKIPCFERNYLVGKTESKFPAANNFPIYQDLKYPKINYTALRLLNKSPDFIGTSYVMQNVDKRTYGMAEPFKDIQEVQDNLMHLRIQLKSMEVVVHRVKFAIGISELITQFGGTISLFIGASVLSFVELGFWGIIIIRKVLKANNIDDTN